MDSKSDHANAPVQMYRSLVGCYNGIYLQWKGLNGQIAAVAGLWCRPSRCIRQSVFGIWSFILSDVRTANCKKCALFMAMNSLICFDPNRKDCFSHHLWYGSRQSLAVDWVTSSDWNWNICASTEPEIFKFYPYESQIALPACVWPQGNSYEHIKSKSKTKTRSKYLQWKAIMGVAPLTLSSRTISIVLVINL